MDGLVNITDAPKTYATTGTPLDWEQEARDLAASVLILVSMLFDWDGNDEGRTPTAVLNEMIPHCKRIVDAPTQSRLFLP